MWKLRIGGLATSGMLALTPGAWAAAGANPNRGDVWLDNVQLPAGPGLSDAEGSIDQIYGRVMRTWKVM